MKNLKVLVTGAAGGMGIETVRQMAEDDGSYRIVATDLPGEKSRKNLEPFRGNPRFTIAYGDLTDYETVKKLVKDCDIVLHIAAFVSPFADYYLEKAMQINCGSTRNFILAIRELHQEETTRFVSIGTVGPDAADPLGTSRRSDQAEHV